ncbi:MAG: hypothetical protein AAFV95_28045 [Bacteroidota bacterium]
MRTTVFVLIVLGLRMATAQTTDTIYYQSLDNKLKAVENKLGDNYYGEYQMWYPNGQLKMKGDIKENGWMGQWAYYNPNGELHKTGEYVNSLHHGEWKMYDLNGQLLGVKTYDNGKLLKVDFLDKTNEIYFEYNCEITDSEEVALVKSFDQIHADEFVLFEPIMESNIQFLEKNPMSQEASVLSQFVTIWTSNCPYLGGQLKIDVTDYTVDWTRLDDGYRYRALMTVYYLIGKCAYQLANKGKPYDLASSEFRATQSMLRAYQAILQQDKSGKNQKLEELAQKMKRGELEDFIRNYKGG